LLSENGLNHGGTSFDLFIQIEIGIGIEFNARWILKNYFLVFLLLAPDAGAGVTE